MIWIAITLGILLLIFGRFSAGGPFGLSVDILGLLSGIYLLIKGADYLVDGAVAIAERMGVSKLFIGLSLVAFGTSAPELAVSITAAVKGHGGIAISNVVGSNIANILLCLGLTALSVRLSVGESTLKMEMPFLLIISASFVFMLLRTTPPSISWNDGAVLFGFLMIFVYYLYRMAQSDMKLMEKEKSINIYKAFLMTGVGLFGVSVGGDITVRSVIGISENLGASESLFALTIVAVGTSLPEMVTSLAAAKKGHHDMSVGNIVGSNLMNILVIMGISSIVGRKLVVDVPMYYVDVSFMLGSVILLWVMSLKRSLGKLQGAIFLSVYVPFILFVIGRR